MAKYEINVWAIYREKIVLAERAKDLFLKTKKKINDNEIYDDLVKRLFRDLLNRAEGINIFFAMRGKSERTAALKEAINKAKTNYQTKYFKEINSQINIFPGKPINNIGFQVVDYFLWALQRLMEKKESRYFDYLKSKFKLIIDLDDKLNHNYGEYYRKSNMDLLIKTMLEKG